MKLMLVGSRDRELERLVRLCAPHASSIPVTELATLPNMPSQPDAIVLDLRGQSMVPPALAIAKRHNPGLGVVIVASALDADLMLSAMRAGVNECVTEPVTQADLEAAITRVVGRSAVAGQVFAFVGAKGGVGATSLAVNVATTLARAAASSALLIDLHMTQGDAALYLGVEPRFSVVEAIQNLHKMDEGYFRSLVTKGPGRLQLLAAPDVANPPRLETANVQALLEFVAKHFEYLVIDVPRTEPAALEALDVVKSIVVVTTQELPAVRSATRLAARLRARYGKDCVLIVMSRLDKQSDISSEDVARAVGAPVAHTFPSDYRLAMASLNRGRPVVMDNHSKLAGSFKSFAGTLAGLNIEAPGTLPSSGGWLGRLGKKK